MNPDPYEFDEDDLRPGDRVRTLPKRKGRLGGAVPVRFPPETIDRIKVQAEREGLTVSSWIRRQVDVALVEREVRVVNFRPGRQELSELNRLSLRQHG